MNKAQSSEVDKYISIYEAMANYTINGRRRKQAVSAMGLLVDRYPDARTCLDVGCGDGAWMKILANDFRLDCEGIDPVPSLASYKIKTALATDLPYADDSFDLVTCLDVMEHLLPEDTNQALNEIKRVSRNGAIITVNNNPSCYRGPNDTELHVNIKPYAEWAEILFSVFGRAEMINNTGGNRVFIV